MPHVSTLKELLDNRELLRGLQSPFMDKLKAKQPLTEKETNLLIHFIVLEDYCANQILTILNQKK